MLGMKKHISEISFFYKGRIILLAPKIVYQVQEINQRKISEFAIFTKVL